MEKRYYAAYGSNLNLRQMRIRCPEAEIIGTSEIEDYQLLFKDGGSGAYLTIEPKEGSRVPVAVWMVTAADEEALDSYENYPSLYYKKEMRLPVAERGTGRICMKNIFVYIMYEESALGVPEDSYVEACLEGYRSFGFDESVLMKARKRGNMKKAVFFDIDGTLWDNRMQVPESTILAIRKLRENGNYAFISSGRSRAAIRAKELLDIGFDGVLAGCGTHVEYRDKIVYEELIPIRKMEEVLRILKENCMPAILEGREHLYADMEDFKGDSYISYLKLMLGDDLRPMGEYDEKSIVNKLSAVCNPEDQERLRQQLGGEWELIFHSSPVVEIVPKGSSKATGIEKICGYLGISHENTYAFGDSTNDLEMLHYVQTGIAMGNATKDAKEAADFVTRDINDDGIQAGLEYFNLI